MIEQLVRIVLISMVLPFFVVPDNPELTAAYAMAITAVGEVVSFRYIYIFIIFINKIKKLKKS